MFFYYDILNLNFLFYRLSWFDDFTQSKAFHLKFRYSKRKTYFLDYLFRFLFYQSLGNKIILRLPLCYDFTNLITFKPVRVRATP